MGRATKDRLELDNDNIVIDEKNADLDSVFSDLQPLILPLRQTTKKRGRKTLVRRDNFPTNIKDWRDPEDDIMYGFKE